MWDDFSYEGSIVPKTSDHENLMSFPTPSDPIFMLSSLHPISHEIIVNEVNYISRIENQRYDDEDDTNDSQDYSFKDSSSDDSYDRLDKYHRAKGARNSLSDNPGSESTVQIFNNGNRKRKLLEIHVVPRNSFSSKKIFYVFADQLINLEYLESVVENRSEQYLKETENRSQFSGMKFINHIEHRMDTMAIEFLFEMVEPPMQDISQIVNMMKSLGNQSIYGFSEKIASFWAEIMMFRTVVFDQWNNLVYQKYREAREEFQKKQWDKLSKEIDPKKYIQYTKYVADYKNGTFDSRLSGLTTALYEFIAGNAYAFKEVLLQKGTHDCVHSKNRIDWCLSTASKYFTDQADGTNLKSYVELGSTASYIVTFDQFTFPITLTITVHNLAFDFDMEHGLKLMINDVMAVYEFTFENPAVALELNNIRRGTKFGQIVDSQDQITESELKEKITKTYTPEFFEKYYQDDLQQLLRKGNKWNKQCGYVDIPQKKLKAITENPFTN